MTELAFVVSYNALRDVTRFQEHGLRDTHPFLRSDSSYKTFLDVTMVNTEGQSLKAFNVRW